MRSNVGTKNAIYNVLQYGARGDGKSDDSRVYISMVFLYNFNQLYVYISWEFFFLYYFINKFMVLIDYD
jgi:hypothetical protein